MTLMKKIATKIVVFGKLFGTTVVSMAYQLKFLSLVTMATNKMFLTLIKKVGIKIYRFLELFRTTVVSMATKSYNQLKFLNLVTMATNKIIYKV